MTSDREGAPLENLPPLSERAFLVTGATDGIGKFTAELLAKEGCTVLIHGRNPEKVQAVVAEMGQLTGCTKLHGIVADLSLMSEVRSLAAEASARFPVLHGLLNNAGTFDGDYTGARRLTDEGNEYSLAVNVMAPFLLTSLLLEGIAASRAGRVVVTSSLSSGASDLLDDLQCEGGWTGHQAYSLSKLCDAMIAMEMHTRYGDPPRLCFHTLDPGTVDTKMLRAGWWSGGASVRTATESFEMLTSDRCQRLSGLNEGGGHGSPAQCRKLWADLEVLTRARWPERGVLQSASQGAALAPAQLWIVVGGSDTAGIVVRKEQSLASEELPRLAAGARIQGLELRGGRLRYRRLSGQGPDGGWVSLAAGGRPLLQRC